MDKPSGSVIKIGSVIEGGREGHDLGYVLHVESVV